MVFDRVLLRSSDTSFFLLILRRPRHYSRFPYTSLFRSRSRQPTRRGRRRCPPVRSAQRRDIAPEPPLDRKSTRLNSSHVANSYAVFFLKQKTNSPLLVRGP